MYLLIMQLINQLIMKYSCVVLFVHVHNLVHLRVQCLNQPLGFTVFTFWETAHIMRQILMFVN